MEKRNADLNVWLPPTEIVVSSLASELTLREGLFAIRTWQTEMGKHVCK